MAVVAERCAFFVEELDAFISSIRFNRIHHIISPKVKNDMKTTILEKKRNDSLA